MKKILFLISVLFALTTSLVAQIYQPDDKQGLRAFLRQPSGIAGKINAEQLGLTVADTINWQTDEAWIDKVPNLMWNNETPKRLTSIGNSSNLGWYSKRLAGSLDATKWKALTHLGCCYNPLTALDVSGCTALSTLWCFKNQLIALDVSGCTALTSLHCSDNHLLLSDLFVASEILKNNNCHGYDCVCFGTQTLHKQNAVAGTEVIFEPLQNVFNSVHTQFTVTKNDNAHTDDYSVTDGKITFNEAGVYSVTMTNAEIFFPISRSCNPTCLIVEYEIAMSAGSGDMPQTNPLMA